MDGALPAPAASALGLKPQALDDSYLIKEGNTLAESGRARAEKAMADKAAALAPIKDRFSKASAEQAALQPPPETKLPTFEHKGMSPEELNSSVMTLFTLAAIGGAMTRAPMTAALNAFAAGIKGLHEGDQELFKRESATFDRELKLATEKSREAGDRYRSIIEKGKGNLQAIENELRIAALEFNDTVTLATLDMKSGKEMVTAGIALRKQADQAEKTRQMFETQTKRLELQQRGQDIQARLGQSRIDAMLQRIQGTQGAKTASSQQAKQRVSGNLGVLAKYYEELQDEGAALSVENGSMENMWNAFASSTIGQAAGRAMGTKSQAIRDKINQITPLLMNDIRQATGMSARSMDSNVELKFYLQAATDPTKLLETNLAALEVLDKQYGLGMGVAASAKAVDALKAQARGATKDAPPVHIESDADFDALATGTKFVAPDGTIRTKP